jgi:hypothetical protein
MLSACSSNGLSTSLLIHKDNSPRQCLRLHGTGVHGVCKMWPLSRQHLLGRLIDLKNGDPMVQAVTDYLLTARAVSHLRSVQLVLLQISPRGGQFRYYLSCFYLFLAVSFLMTFPPDSWMLSSCLPCMLHFLPISSYFIT